MFSVISSNRHYGSLQAQLIAFISQRVYIALSGIPDSERLLYQPYL